MRCLLTAVSKRKGLPGRLDSRRCSLDSSGAKASFRKLKRTIVRSNAPSFTEDDDHKWVAEVDEITRIAEEIEARRIAMKKTSGFKQLYARVTKLYFGGMARHLADLRSALKSGAMLGYVVGDQASYLAS